MKNIYVMAMVAMSSIALAQETISFEAAEGYGIGTMHGQNGWEVTEGADGFITGQVVSTAKASAGTQSFKNGFEPEYGDQWFPIMGVVKTFATPANYNSFTISYDILVTAKLGSDFEFTLFAVDQDDYYVPIAGVGFENRGYIYLIDDVNYGFEYAEAEWLPNEWNNMKIEVTTDNIKYYVNNVLQLSIPNYTSLDIVGINMLHNNYGNDGFYDNFVITTTPLGVTPVEDSSVSVYPNPASDIITVQTTNGSQFTNVDIYNTTGQKLKSFDSVSNINISDLAAGAYILKATTADGATMSRKIIRK